MKVGVVISSRPLLSLLTKHFDYYSLTRYKVVFCYIPLKSSQALRPLQPVGLLGLGISPTQGRYLTQTQNEHKYISIL
jgi:hypothetical protein